MPKPYKTNVELIKEYFLENGIDFDATSKVVSVEFLKHNDFGSNYRISFENGEVSDWNVHYEEDQVVDADCYNWVINATE